MRVNLTKLIFQKVINERKGNFQKNKVGGEDNDSEDNAGRQKGNKKAVHAFKKLCSAPSKRFLNM